MNKNSYRIIYNKARNMFMAVAENVKSQSKTSGQSAASTSSSSKPEPIQQEQAFHQLWQVKALVASISFWTPLAPVYADIIADSAANAANRAVIAAGKNTAGITVPVVNIQTPKNGVSHNIYKQFDVLSQGAVINNSRTGTSSQIVGTVAANPFLATGEARVILNEVNSSALSRFEGNLEIAGQMADVIIANPSGINIKGGGFINANKATFTTAKPQLNADGSIQQFTINQGKVTVSANAGSTLGLGGNNNNANYVDIYARALELNAQLYAKNDIQAISGSNTISADSQQVIAKTGTGVIPTLAVDVKALGGMYANNIYLMGTEQGLGVNNAGTLQAVNNLVVTNAGKIEHSGSMSSTSKTQGLVNIATTGTGVAGDINSSGTISSNAMLNIDSGNNLNLNAKEILINVGGVASSPLLINAKGNINLAANTRILNDSQGGDLYIDAANLNLANNAQIISNRGSATIQVEKDLIAATGAKFIAAKDLNLIANKDLKLIGNTLQASTGSINLQSIAADAQLLQIDGGTLYASKDLNIYGSGDVSLKNLSFNLVNNATRLKDINIYSGKNLTWDNKTKPLPKISGKVQLEAKQGLDLSGTALHAANGIITQSDTLNLNTTVKSDQGIDLTTQKAMTLAQGSSLTAVKDINLASLQGNIQAQSLKVNSTTGHASIIAHENVNINSVQTTVAANHADRDEQITDKTVINADQGIVIASAEKGTVSVNSAELTSAKGDLKILGQNGVNLDANTDVIVSGDNGHDTTLTNQLKGKSVSIVTKKGNIDIKNTALISTVDQLHLNSEAGMLSVADSKFQSKGNTEIYAKDILTLKNITANSDQHLAVNSKRTLYLNADYTPTATVWHPSAKTNLTAKGVLSLTATGNQVMQNAQLTGGAVLLETTNLFMRPGLVFNATGSDLLKNDTKLNSLNGDLSIQTTGANGLTIDPKIMSLTAVGDIDLVAKNGALTLAGYSGAQGNGSEQVVKLNITGGGINLEGTKIDIQGAHLASEKDIKIVSNNGDIQINAINNKLNNNKLSDSNRLLSDLKEIENKFNAISVNNKYTDSFFNDVKLLENSYDKAFSFNPSAYNGDASYKIGTETDISNFNKIYEDFLKKYSDIIEPNKYTQQINGTKYSTQISIAVPFGDGDYARKEDILSPNGYFKYKYDKNKIKDELNYLSNLFGYEHISSKLVSNLGSVNVTSSKGTSISGSELTAKIGLVNIEAQGVLAQNYISTTLGKDNKPRNIGSSIIIDGTQDFYDKGNENDSNYSFRTLINPTFINGSKGVNIRTVGTTVDDNLVMQATGIISQGDIKIESNKNILFDSAIEQSYDRSTTTEKKKSWGGLKKKYITTVSENNQADAASVDIYGKNIIIESKDKNKDVNIDIYSGKFTAKGGILSIKAGGNLNFYTVEESASTNVDITKKSSFAGIKYNTSKTNATRTQVTELPATLKADYIGTKSGFDTRLEGTEFEYLKGATIESGGTLQLIAAKTNITELLKKEKNSVVWQSMQDQGSITETAKLPQFNGPVLPTFKASGGIVVQVPISEKDINKKELRDQILILANQPGNTYLKELVNRNDIDWQKVILAQKDWDYKSQGLTGAGAAIIVIIVTIVTMGTGTAAATGAAGAGGAAAGGTTVGMGASMLGAAGVTTTTVGGVTTITGISTLGAMANAAVTSLATQASVGLINNGGDIGKTLKDLGSKDSIKNLAASVVSAGLLSQVGTALKLKPESTLLPDRLINNFTTSVGSTLVQTAIKGGDLEDNLKVALLAGLAGAVQGEIASQIGGHLDKVDPNVFEYTIHKIAHAAAGCAVAAATKASCEAGAIGAGVGEIVAGLMIPEGKTALDLTDNERTRIKDTSKLIAGTTAAFAGYDVNTAANSANIAVENNALKPLSTVGKTVWKTAKAIKEQLDAGKKIQANDLPELLKDVVKGEIQNGGDSIKTLIDPNATAFEKSLAILDLVIGVDLKAGKNVDILKVDQKVIEKNTPTKVEMLGEKGIRLDSKTVWKMTGTKARIDVENPAPGKRAGQIHYQDIDNKKYLYDPKTNKFYVGFDKMQEAPKSIQALLNNPSFKAGIDKAKKYLGEI